MFISFEFWSRFYRLLLQFTQQAWKQSLQYILRTCPALPEMQVQRNMPICNKAWPGTGAISSGDTMISCRKHATNDDIVLTVAQHSSRTAVLAFKDINMYNRWMYVQQVAWNSITCYWYCKPIKPQRSMALPKSHKSCRQRLQTRAAEWNTTEQLPVSSGFNWFQPYSYGILKHPCASHSAL